MYTAAARRLGSRSQRRLTVMRGEAAVAAAHAAATAACADR